MYIYIYIVYMYIQYIYTHTVYIYTVYIVYMYTIQIYIICMFVHTSFGIYRNSSGTVGIPCVKKHRDRTGCSQMEVYSCDRFLQTLMT